MKTGETARFMRLTLKVASYLGTSPYIWLDEGEVVEFSGTRTPRYFAFLVQVFLYLIYESYVIARWVQMSIFDPSATNREKIGLQYVAFAYTIPVALNICSFVNTDQLHLLINRIMRYQQSCLSGKTQLRQPVQTQSEKAN